MTLNSEILSKVKSYGIFKYSIEKIIRLLNILPNDRELFITEFKNETSELRRYYEQGVAMGEHNISIALMKKAEEGDVFASQQLEDLIDKRRVENLRKELFGV